MSSGNWLNSDGLFLQFGTAKATAETAGEYLSYGANRVVEVLVDLSLLNTSTATILSYNTFFPAGANIYIEQVEVTAEVAAVTSGGTLSVGLIQDDQSTVFSGGGTAFLNAIALSGFATAGDKITYTTATSGVGGYVGDYQATYNTNAFTTTGANSLGGYLTAKLGTATATGKLRVRIYYHGVGTISY